MGHDDLSLLRKRSARSKIIKETIVGARERARSAASGPMRRGASSSARWRDRPQNVPENAVLDLKRARAVVLVVSRGHHDNEMEFRDDADRLPAPAKRANPVDLTLIEP
jgi:hypothetical protein